jgi:hypothetical protein
MDFAALDPSAMRLRRIAKNVAEAGQSPTGR